MMSKELELLCTSAFGVNIRKGPMIDSDIVGEIRFEEIVVVDKYDYESKSDLDYIRLIKPKSFVNTFVRKKHFKVMEKSICDVEETHGADQYFSHD